MLLPSHQVYCFLLYTRRSCAEPCCAGALGLSYGDGRDGRRIHQAATSLACEHIPRDFYIFEHHF